MAVKETTPNMLCLEYKQEKNDKDYGSCLWARFMFNLDKYELLISSDCGFYGYKWCETPDTESFLELMARVDKDYMLRKLYGEPDVFDYEASKANIYEELVFEGSTLTKELLDEIFAEIESDYGEHFYHAHSFMDAFKCVDNKYYENFLEYDYPNVYGALEYRYPADALKIVNVFDGFIKPNIQENLSK